MSNMTIENIGKFIQGGDVSQVIEHGRSIQAPEPPNAAPGNDTVQSFGEMLKSSLDQTNEVQAQADRAVKELAAGRNKNVHETMLLIEKADMSFKMMMQVRNKVIEAYREIMRMQV